MRNTDISKKLIELEQRGFISRTNYNADQSIARGYVLNEKWWPDYRIKEMKKFASFH